MSEIAVKIIPEVPIKLNIFNFSELPIFAESTKGIEALERHRKSIRNGMTFYIVLWGSLIVYVLYHYITGNKLEAIMAVTIGSYLIRLAQGKSTYKERADSKLWTARYQHCHDIANFISKNYIKNSTHFSYCTEAFIYNNNMCAYCSTTTGEFVVYSKTSIKDISRERVYVGTKTTTSGTESGTINKGFFNDYNYKSTVNATSDSQAMYEWHFDVFTDYMPYPKISMVIPDGNFAEKCIGEAYAVLKP